jgi:hypothetical protein
MISEGRRHRTVELPDFLIEDHLVEGRHHLALLEGAQVASFLAAGT